MRNAKFLGVVMDDTISWKHHIQALQCKVSKSVGMLYRAASKLGTRKLYTIQCTLVLPYLQYCVILWGITYKSKLKALTMLQKRAMRIVLKTSRQSHVRPVFYKLKALHFDDIVNVNIAAFMHKAFYKEFIVSF